MANFDLREVPFSTFGSYMSVSILSGRRSPEEQEGLYVRGHHNGSHPLFRVMATESGGEAAVNIEAGPTLVRLAGDVGFVELCFDGPETLRMRGSGLGVKLEGVKGSVTYATTPALMTVNVRRATRRYQIECLAGSLTLHRFRRPDGRRASSIEVAPDAGGSWEIAVDEFASTWASRERESFDACAAAAAEQFDAFLRDMPPAPADLADARKIAAYVDYSATVHPEGLLHRPAMLMSKNWMCNVWSWDHCFNAMALAPGRADLAWEQMLLMVDHQDAFGSLPDSVNDVEKHYNFSKPPIHGWTVGELLTRAPAPPREVLATMCESIGRQVNWWMTHRRYESDELPYYLHGNDSGWDNSTMFDQGVPLIAPDLAAFLVVSCDELAGLCERLDRPRDAGGWREQADRLMAALMNTLWRDGRFIALATHEKKPVICDSLIPCMPLLLGSRLPKDVVDMLVASLQRFLTDWGLATEHPSSEAYNENGYWRGPIWAPSTYIAVCGLERCGQHELAREVARRFCRMCAASGYAENFDALTGAGLCDRAYTWTASVFLLLAERLAAS